MKHDYTYTYEINIQTQRDDTYGVHIYAYGYLFFCVWVVGFWVVLVLMTNRHAIGYDIDLSTSLRNMIKLWFYANPSNNVLRGWHVFESPMCGWLGGLLGWFWSRIIPYVGTLFCMFLLVICLVLSLTIRSSVVYIYIYICNGFWHVYIHSRIYKFWYVSVE